MTVIYTSIEIYDFNFPFTSLKLLPLVPKVQNYFIIYEYYTYLFQNRCKYSKINKFVEIYVNYFFSYLIMYRIISAGHNRFTIFTTNMSSIVERTEKMKTSKCLGLNTENIQNLITHQPLLFIALIKILDNTSKTLKKFCITVRKSNDTTIFCTDIYCRSIV